MRLQTVERKAEWAERKNILWPETCWTLRAGDQRLCRGGEGCSLACSGHINHHQEDILKANYMECFLGKSSPRPCKSSLALAGIQICLGGGWCASAPQCQVEELHRVLIWSLELVCAFLLSSSKGAGWNTTICHALGVLELGLTTGIFHLLLCDLQTLYKVEWGLDYLCGSWRPWHWFYVLLTFVTSI